MKIERKLHKIDATDMILGKLAVEIANLLRGKNKVDFTPNIDNGDLVEVSNFGKIKVTGRKMTDKMYHRFSGHIGGITTTSLQDYLAKQPNKLLRQVVYNMLPKNKTRDVIIKRLKLV